MANGNSGDDRINPFEVMAFEADVTNLYGLNYTIGHEGDANRLSHQDAVTLRTAVTNTLSPYVVERTIKGFNDKPLAVLLCMPSDDHKDQINSYLDHGLRAVAKGQLRGRELSGFISVVGVLAHGWYAEKRHIDLEDELLTSKATAVYELAFAVGMLEGNIAPNDLGYRFDETVSLPNKHRIVAESLTKATDIVRQSGTSSTPGVLGEIVNDILDRCERNHPTFMGSPIGNSYYDLWLPEDEERPLERRESVQSRSQSTPVQSVRLISTDQTDATPTPLIRESSSWKSAVTALFEKPAVRRVVGTVSIAMAMIFNPSVVRPVIDSFRDNTLKYQTIDNGEKWQLGEVEVDGWRPSLNPLRALDIRKPLNQFAPHPGLSAGLEISGGYGVGPNNVYAFDVTVRENVAPPDRDVPDRVSGVRIYVDGKEQAPIDQLHDNFK